MPSQPLRLYQGDHTEGFSDPAYTALWVLKSELSRRKFDSALIFRGLLQMKPRTVEWNPPKNNGDKSKCIKGENCCQTQCVLPVSGSHACPQLRVWILRIIIMPTHSVWTSHFYQLRRSHAVPADRAWHDFAPSGLGGSRLWWGFYSAVSECVHCVVCQSQAQNISFSKAVDLPCFPSHIAVFLLCKPLTNLFLVVIYVSVHLWVCVCLCAHTCSHTLNYSARQVFVPCKYTFIIIPYCTVQLFNSVLFLFFIFIFCCVLSVLFSFLLMFALKPPPSNAASISVHPWK